MVYRSTWCEVDTRQFRQNISILKGLAGTRLLQVVKANAYGHGLVPMALEAVKAGADMLGVATIGEAEQLIDNEVDAPVLIMCGMDHTEIEWCVAHEVHFLAWRRDQFDTSLKAAANFGTTPMAHIEIDSGMSRSGVAPKDFKAFVLSLSAEQRSTIFGMATHFPAADEEELDAPEAQLDEFLKCVELANAEGIRPLVHAANSPATLRMPRSHLDMVRMGVSGYGIKPADFIELPDGVAPVLSWKANVTNVMHLEAGRGVTYGWEYVATSDETVATLAVGYADGFHRMPPRSNTVLLGGVETPVLGRVCMDQCVVRVPENINVDVGDTAVLLGSQGDKSLSADELGTRWNTISYDVLAGIRGRVPRQYVE